MSIVYRKHHRRSSQQSAWRHFYCVLAYGTHDATERDSDDQRSK